MSRSFALGINYPWTVLGGKPNMGCDFGRNIWRSHAGVSTHRADVRADFEAMAAMGVTIARWFVLTDGRGGIEWDARRRPTGLAPGFFEDMDAALEIATETNVDLCLVLFDFSWMLHQEQRAADGELLFVTQPGLLATEAGLARITETVVDPFFARYGTGGLKSDLGRAIRMIDVMNEPDWVTRELAPTGARDEKTGKRTLERPFDRDELQRFVRAIADRVHARFDGADTRAKHETLVTVGGGRVKFAAEWDDPAYGIDVIQVHSYPDEDHPERDESVIGRDVGSFGLSKPLLIGEHPANGNRLHPSDHRPPDFSLTDYVRLARDGGYAGAWPWSFKGIDGFGAADPDEMRAATQPEA